MTTTAGNHPNVESLVYVAAFLSADGETTGTLNADHPSLLDPAGVIVSEDGFVSISERGFIGDIAPDLPEDEARFLFASQTPTTSSVFMAETSDPAWLHKPSFAVVASNDRVVSPDLQRKMYERAGSIVTEVEASHMVYVSQPEAVANVIIEAAQSLEEGGVR